MGLVVKKCLKCGAMIEVIKPCTCDNCGFKCCGEAMVELKPNTVDASVEKHLPKVKVVDDKIIVTVEHVMEDVHHIEWIALHCKDKVGKKHLKPGMEAIVTFPYVKGSKVYAYCNKHGLWCVEVE